MRLRNGSNVADPHLDRIYPGLVSHLPSLKFLVANTQIATQPLRSYTWPLHNWLDQGSEGRCVEYSLCHELLAVPVGVRYEFIQKILFGKLIYWAAQMEDPWPGGSYPGAVPQEEGTSVQAGTKVAARLGFYGEYRWALNATELARYMVYKGGGPAVIGINWYGDMFTPDENNFSRIGNSNIEGGHAICVVGVHVRRAPGGFDFDQSFFVLHNSWGANWGKNGRCRVSWADMERLIQEEGEVMLPIQRKIPKVLVTNL